MTKDNQKPNEATIRRLAQQQSFDRGREYYESGAVLELAQRGDELLAEVEGSSYEPYQVRVVLRGKEIQTTTCDCLYDWGGICKHTVATLLTYIHNPGRLEHRPVIADLLEDLERDQLQALLLNLVERQPDLADLIEGQVMMLRNPPDAGEEAQAAPRRRQTTLDPKIFRRQARAALRSLSHMRPSEAYWHVGEVVAELGNILDQVYPFLDAGDGENALIILQGFTEALLEDWTILDDSSGEVSGFWADLSSPWTEALLSVDLSRGERVAWAKQLDVWESELSGYGLEGIFDAAAAAALQGWDYAPLRRVIEEGEITDKGAWENEAPWFADDLALARLNVLERQQRLQEYVRLAEAEGQMEKYAIMLVKLGRVEEAVDVGLNRFDSVEEALRLAQALQEQGESEYAWQVGKHGLTLEYGYSRVVLANWLRELAWEAGWTDRALEAAEAAFREYPSLDTYLAAEALGDERWPEVKVQLLEILAQTSHTNAKIDVYLYEGDMVDEAVRVVDEDEYAHYAGVAKVVEVAKESHPDWVIRQCRRQAERIMDAGKSKYYDHAANWLSRARDVYLATDREADWQDYLNSLLSEHHRKYSLVPRLKELQ